MTGRGREEPVPLTHVLRIQHLKCCVKQKRREKVKKSGKKGVLRREEGVQGKRRERVGRC